jgi:hypothetical protein
MRLQDITHFRREQSLDSIPIDQVPAVVTIVIHYSKGVVREFVYFKDRPIVCDDKWMFFFLPKDVGLLKMGPYRAKKRNVRLGENGDKTYLYVATIELLHSDITTITHKGDE